MIFYKGQKVIAKAKSVTKGLWESGDTFTVEEITKCCEEINLKIKVDMPDAYTGTYCNKCGKIFSGFYFKEECFAVYDHEKASEMFLDHIKEML